MSERDELTVLQRAALALKVLRDELDALKQAQSQPAAIVGMACRFPGAETPDAFWRLLSERGDGVREVPADRWDLEAYYDPDLAPGTMNTRRGGFIDDIDQFDAAFFDVSVREAASMDPQQRLFLEVAWEALESAGISPHALAGSRSGVFAGVCGWDYSLLHRNAPPRGSTGVSLSIVANRTSYFLDLRGPSFVVDTACSSSLLTVHLACQSLRAGECDLALAGGVNAILSPASTVSFAQAGMMAPDGRCKTFDAAANGYVRGEGCGVLVLKRLSDAIAAGDPILATVQGSATNQDGRSNGLTAPNGAAQVDVIARALERAGVAPHEISYVEAHGTATPLGDAVEVESLVKALGPGRSADQTCLLSSVKSNIGHLEAAAGVASLIKVVLAMRHGRVPAVAHFESLSPKIDFGGVPLVVPRTLSPWPAWPERRYAGVSGFSFGGSNVHVVLAEPPRAEAPAVSDEGFVHILPLSAKDPRALRELAARYAAQLGDDAGLGDVCYTAGSGRATFAERLAIVAGSVDELRGRLHAFAVEGQAAIHRGKAPGAPPRVALVLPGRGAPPAAIRDLLATQPAFQGAIDRCERATRARLGAPSWSVLDDPSSAHGALAIEIALAELLRAWGVELHGAIGLGAGAAAAAHVTGAIGIEDAIDLAAALVDPARAGVRGRSGACPGGAPERRLGDRPAASEPLAAPGCDIQLVLGPAGGSDAGRAGRLIDMPEGRRSWSALAEALAELYVRGAAIDWRAYHAGFARRRVALPTYPFSRRRCWLDPDEIRRFPARRAG